MEERNMPRLIYKPTWVQICSTLGCRRKEGRWKPTEFDEPGCPACGHRFDARKMRVVAPERLILIGGVQTTHEKVAVCRCGRCENVFDLEDSHWWDITFSIHSHCQACHKPIWQTKEELAFLCEEGMTNFDRAWKVEEWRTNNSCRDCGAKFPPIPWCPLCANEPVLPAESCLPTKLLMVWRRIHGRTVQSTSGQPPQVQSHRKTTKQQDAPTYSSDAPDPDTSPDPEIEDRNNEDTNDEDNRN
jgi:hypothetical protein